jgi:hypothetical protein
VTALTLTCEQAQEALVNQTPTFGLVSHVRLCPRCGPLASALVMATEPADLSADEEERPTRVMPTGSSEEASPEAESP